MVVPITMVQKQALKGWKATNLKVGQRIIISWPDKKQIKFDGLTSSLDIF
jgi:hypothetical protein